MTEGVRSGTGPWMRQGEISETGKVEGSCQGHAKRGRVVSLFKGLSADSRIFARSVRVMGLTNFDTNLAARLVAIRLGF